MLELRDVTTFAADVPLSFCNAVNELWKYDSGAMPFPLKENRKS